MREGIISVGLDAPAQPSDRFLVGAEQQFGETDKHHPPVGIGIARREAKRLVDMGLGLRAATEKKLGETDEGMSVGQIAIQRQRLLAFGDALGRRFVKIWTHPRYIWARAWFGTRDRALVKAASAAAKGAFRSSVERVGAKRHFNNRAEPTSASILSGSSARARSKKSRACDMYSGSSPCSRKPALEIQVHRIRMGERSARRASASMSWAFSVLASRDTISSCMSNRSATGLSNRSAQR